MWKANGRKVTAQESYNAFVFWRTETMLKHYNLILCVLYGFGLTRLSLGKMYYIHMYGKYLVAY